MILAILLLVTMPRLGAPQQAQAIPATESRQFLGRTATVEGEIVRIRTAASGAVYLYLDTEPPHQSLTIVVPPALAGQIPDLRAWRGRRVRVTGLVQKGRDAPQIVLDRTDHLQPAPEPARIPCGAGN